MVDKPWVVTCSHYHCVCIDDLVKQDRSLHFALPTPYRCLAPRPRAAHWRRRDCWATRAQSLSPPGFQERTRTRGRRSIRRDRRTQAARSRTPRQVARSPLLFLTGPSRTMVPRRRRSCVDNGSAAPRLGGRTECEALVRTCERRHSETHITRHGEPTLHIHHCESCPGDLCFHDHVNCDY